MVSGVRWRFGVGASVWCRCGWCVRGCFEDCGALMRRVCLLTDSSNWRCAWIRSSLLLGDGKSMWYTWWALEWGLVCILPYGLALRGWHLWSLSPPCIKGYDVYELQSCIVNDRLVAGFSMQKIWCDVF